MIHLRHVGNGVIIAGRSGISYRAMPGDIVEFLPPDAEGLLDHPEWESLDDDYSEDKPLTNGDNAEKDEEE